MPGYEWFGDEERREVLEVLDTGVLFRYGFDQVRKGRWKAKEFERTLSERIGVKYSHLCSSGTAALSVALAACGIGGGDEVIVPPFTFVATVEAVLGAGAVPIFAEIDETLCLDPASVKTAVTDRTKAILPVHMCGSMAKIDELNDIARQYGLMMIEDACQALGGSFHGKSLGSWGNIGCFSFDPVKTVTCGEGGAIVTNDLKLYQQADQYADHGHDHIGNDRGQENHPILGYNYRISELNAAVGLAQLRKLDNIIDRQRNLKSQIKNSLTANKHLRFREIPDPQGDSASFLTFFTKDAAAAENLMADIKRAGVGGFFYWFNNNWHYFRQWNHVKKLLTPAKLPLYREAYPDYNRIKLPQSDEIMSRTISLLIQLNWTEADVLKRIELLGG